MPIHRYTCSKCSRSREQLEHRDLAAPECCGVAMGRAMPSRVVGRVVPDSNGVHAGSGFAASRPDVWAGERVAMRAGDHEHVAELHEQPGQVGEAWMGGRAVEPVIGDVKLGAVPQPTGGAFAKDWRDCTAADKDARWRDTVEAVTATHVGMLELNGHDPSEARRVVAPEVVKTITRAREEAPA